MRRSFGGGGSGMGGGNGGGMLRTVHRAVRAGVGGAPSEPFSSASANSTTIGGGANSRKKTNFNNKISNHPNTALTLSSSSNENSSNGSSSSSASFSSQINFPGSAGFGAGGPNCSDEIMGWECVDGIEEEDERARLFYEDFVFGNVPSSDEVNHAVSALQQVLEPSFYKRVPKEEFEEDTVKDVVDEVNSPMAFGKKISSEMDWIEPSMHLCNSRILQPRGSDRVYDAFRLLQTEPSVQKMVISLSSDRAIWDAVLNNEAVKELRADINGIGEKTDEGSDDGSNPLKDIMSWVFVNSKAIIMQMIDKIAKIVNEAFQPLNEEKNGGSKDPLEENLKTSLFLSIVVLLIVVVTRAQIA
ncbi:hypothetical protein ACJIZ3_009386 [Penstemon smallii]|uniref:Uncharacterized protein n=1 Tax=Penstemon smallii TaxID=265156 RepID=A0ABD3TCD0_9LAMI